MATLGDNRWGKSSVRVSKVIRGDGPDVFLDLEVQVLLGGDVAAAYQDGDNRLVLPTDTTRNTIYGLAQEHLNEDLEAFGAAICRHMAAKDGIDSVEVTIRGRRWDRQTPTGFTGGGQERRVALVSSHRGAELVVQAGIEGLVVLKTGGSAFTGFPRDGFTTLPEAEDRLLSTSVTAVWDYSTVPPNTTEVWQRVRQILLDRFFEDWSASVQHQGWMMAQATLESVPEISSISFELPNQHHLSYDLTRFGMEHHSTVFHPVSEPYGDIRFTVTR